MEILKLVGIVWLCLLFLTCLGMVVGVIIERKVDESHPIKNGGGNIFWLLTPMTIIGKTLRVNARRSRSTY